MNVRANVRAYACVRCGTIIAGCALSLVEAAGPNSEASRPRLGSRCPCWGHSRQRSWRPRQGNAPAPLSGDWNSSAGQGPANRGAPRPQGRGGTSSGKGPQCAWAEVGPVPGEATLMSIGTRTRSEGVATLAQHRDAGKSPDRQPRVAHQEAPDHPRGSRKHPTKYLTTFSHCGPPTAQI